MIAVDGHDVSWREGMTLATLLAQLDDGDIYAVVKLNGKLVSRPQFDRTPVPDGSQVVPIPMIAGG